MADFTGKVALITGGGVGIGRAAAIAFANAGAKVVIGNRNADKGAEVVELIKAAGGDASFIRTDVTSEDDIKAMVDHTVATYGRLDAAFNNAGVEGRLSPITEQTDENYSFVMDTNVKGVFLSMKHQIPAMLKNGSGAIVNNSSVAGLIGFPGIGIYAASKHAVMGLTKSAALEYATAGVRVNSVNAAVIDTSMAERLAAGIEVDQDYLNSMHPIGRTGKPEEVAAAVLWLCSDDASFVTGTSLAVDGAYTAQ
jgi:NAD(P)-dependent dehydrogenase (short-subunit alcohol dehydrogenase family)